MMGVGWGRRALSLKCPPEVRTIPPRLLCIIVAMACSLLPVVSPTVVVTAEDFVDAVSPHQLAIVSFGSRECPACHQFSPNLEEVAAVLEGQVFVGMSEVESAYGQLLFDRYEVEDYPTVLLFQFGKVVGEYVGTSVIL